MNLKIKGVTYQYAYETEGLFNFEEVNGSMYPKNLKEMSVLMLVMVMTCNKDADIEPKDFYNALGEDPGAFLEFQEAHTAYTKRQNALLEKYLEGKKKVTEESSL